MGILQFLSVFFSNPLPELSLVDARIQYSGFKKNDEKKNAFFHNKSLF